jgi:regulator of protease activity HflC (stomatin/prohibitin superfamily)
MATPLKKDPEDKEEKEKIVTSKTKSHKHKEEDEDKLVELDDDLLTFDDIMNNKDLQSHIKKMDDVLATKNIKGELHDLDDVVIPSELKDLTPEQQTDKIVEKFNRGTNKCFTESVTRGEQINKGEFLLGLHNTTAELHGPSNTPIARRLLATPGKKTKIIGTYKQTETFFGKEGSYVLNVPKGEYAKAWSNNVPKLYGDGVHVIHDPTFSLNHHKKKDKDGNSIDDIFVKQSSKHIKHNTIHIIWVENDKVAKISMGTTNYLLESRSEPYVFNNPLFKFDEKDIVNRMDTYIHNGMIHVLRVPNNQIAKIRIGNVPYFLVSRKDPYIFNNPLFVFDEKTDLVNQTDTYIQNGTLHSLRVPAGYIAEVLLNTKPYLLPSRREPYIINNPQFVFDEKKGLVKETEVYIHWKTIHKLRVPAQKIIKAWKGAEPLLLESRVKPYYFDDPTFDVFKEDNGGFLYDATSQWMQHGTLKRIIPKTGEVAITYQNGHLKVYDPNKTGEPIRIDSSTHEVKGFLSTVVETIVFPSKEVIGQRTDDAGGKYHPDMAYEIFQTSDSLKVGVKLLVAYQIVDPVLALTSLRDEKGILKHIENTAVADMSKAIQKCTSQEFTSFNQTQPKKTEPNPFTKQNPVLHYQDIVKKDLADDLKNYGIDLIRLNIETFKVMDPKISEAMEKQAMLSAETNAEANTMEQKYQINKKLAEQEAETKRIQQEQLNNAKMSQAQTEFEAAKLRSDALLITAEAEKRMTEMKGEAEKNVAEMKGKVYTQNPQLFQLELAKINASMLNGASLNLTSEGLANMFRNPIAILNSSNMTQK